MRVNIADVIAAVEKKTGPWTALEIKDLLLKLALKESENQAADPRTLTGYSR